MSARQSPNVVALGDFLDDGLSRGWVIELERDTIRLRTPMSWIVSRPYPGRR